MKPLSLERKLVLVVLVLFVVPTGLVGAVVLWLYRGGALDDPSALAATVGIGLVAMAVYLSVVAHAIGRTFVRALHEIQLGAELMGSVNPEHRLDIRTGDELQTLAEEVNRMADRLRESRSLLEREVARATRELDAERAKLSAVLETLGEGVVLAAPDGRVGLANPAAQRLLVADGDRLLGGSLFELVDRDKVVYYLERLRAGSVAERFSLHPRGTAVLDSVMTPFRDTSGRLMGFILVLRDVTRPARRDEARQRVLADTLREIRGSLSSIRSLSESLLGGTSSGAESDRRLLEVVHAEAERLSVLVGDFGARGGLALPPTPWHFEEVAVADLVEMTLSRLGQAGCGRERVRVEGDLGAMPPLRAEVSALSGTLATLGRDVLARSGPAASLRISLARQGTLTRLDLEAEGHATLDELEAVLDATGGRSTLGELTARENVHRHAGEVWAWAEGGRFGFRLTLPPAERRETPDPPTAAPRFVGAGTVSGFGGADEVVERPALYDFSLLEEMERYLRPVDLERSLDELDGVVLDTETTGLDPDGGDRIVSLAGVRLRGGVLRAHERFDALVNPGRPIPAASVRFHGVTDEAVRDAPSINVVLPAFLRFAEGAVLIGHQVWFDLRFLHLATQRLGLPPLTATHPVLDTLTLSEVVHGRLEEHGLDALAERLGVDVRGRHSALGDALATGEIFVRLVELLKRRGISTLGQALAAERRTRTAGPR